MSPGRASSWTVPDLRAAPTSPDIVPALVLAPLPGSVLLSALTWGLHVVFLVEHES